MVNFLETSALRSDQRADVSLLEIIQALESGNRVREGYTLQNDLLHYRTRLVLPATSTWIPRVLFELHDSALGGHSGFYRTFKRVSANVFWRGMKKDIQTYVAHCEVCQKSKYDALAPAGLLQPLPIPIQI